jgi:hypothetical protein
MNRALPLLAVAITAFLIYFLAYDARENAAIHERAQRSLMPKESPKPTIATRIDPTWLDRELSKLQSEKKTAR